VGKSELFEMQETSVGSHSGAAFKLGLWLLVPARAMVQARLCLATQRPDPQTQGRAMGNGTSAVVSSSATRMLLK